jgi:hypothetical protein
MERAAERVRDAAERAREAKAALTAASALFDQAEAGCPGQEEEEQCENDSGGEHKRSGACTPRAQPAAARRALSPLSSNGTAEAESRQRA